MHGGQISYRSGDGRTQLSGYLAVPDGAGPRPAVLILRGVAGPMDGYTEIADRIAGWGYVAFQHGWKQRGDDPPDDLVIDDLAGALTYLRGRNDVDEERLAVFGFCRGGVHALMAAAAFRQIGLVCIFHGFAFRPAQGRPGLQPFALMQTIAMPTLILHGTEDEQAPVEGMRRLESILSPEQSVRFKYYDRARHGFAVRTHPGFDAPTAKESFEEAHGFIDSRFLQAK